MDRRTFIQTGVLAALPLATGRRALTGDQPAPAEQRTSRSPLDLYTVVYDDRFAASVAFAEQARRLGYRTAAIRGDVTDLWYHDLYHRWQQGPVAIAGMTTPDASFCLEIFGNDAGLRRVLNVEHTVAQPGTIAHRVHAPASAFELAGLEQCGDEWSARMAHVVTGCVPTHERVQATIVSTGAGNTTEQPELVSWLLVPRQQIV